MKYTPSPRCARFNEFTFSPLKIRRASIEHMPVGKRSIEVNPIIKTINGRIEGAKRNINSAYYNQITLLGKFYKDIYHQPDMHKNIHLQPNNECHKTASISPQFINIIMQLDKAVKPHYRNCKTRHSSFVKAIDFYKRKIQNRQKPTLTKENVSNTSRPPSVEKNIPIITTDLHGSMTVQHLPLYYTHSPFTKQRASYSQQTNIQPSILFNQINRNLVNPSKVYVPISTLKQRETCSAFQIKAEEECQQLSGWDIDDGRMKV